MNIQVRNTVTGEIRAVELGVHSTNVKVINPGDDAFKTILVTIDNAHFSHSLALSDNEELLITDNKEEYGHDSRFAYYRAEIVKD